MRLLVDSGPPLAVNSGAKVTNLNADKLDGKSATQIGLNGREVVSVPSATSSNSPKMLTVSCPAGKFVVGTGFDLSGGKTGTEPNAQTDVVIDQLFPGFNAVALSAYEETPTSANWNVSAYAVCAKAP